ncbi:fluoride efflux transporter CrcB [Campylobacter concisus]|uniref:fluoride efflux transporter CrcB n=1 Tax=Campylobacter concisus TaxID=199 RepID=UPI00122CFC83|nr:fluoride efflux transporter CrcB [Campylobacter concisus]
MLANLLFAGLGGFIGAGCRFLAGELLKFSHFPLTILGVNVLGSFIIGILFCLNLSQSARVFLVVGVLGGFTTFSSFSLDSVKFLLEGELVKGFLNIFLNLVLCLIASFFGILLGKSL